MAAWIDAATVQQWIGAGRITLDAAASLAQAATDAMRSYLERDLEMGSWTEFYDAMNTDYILLQHWPVRSIDQVLYQGNPVAAASIQAGQAKGWRIDGFITRKLWFAGYGKLPRAPMAIQVVNLKAGYDVGVSPGSTPTAMPGHVVQALQLTCLAIFTSQAIDPNLTGESISGVFSGSFVPTGPGSIPPGAMALVRNERRAAP